MPYTGDDMYRNILKEIGAGESNMDYLFDDDDNDDDDDDYDDRGGDEEIIVQQDNNDHSIHKGVVAVQQLRYDDQPHQSSKGFDSSSDEELLNQWETEDEGNDDDDDDDDMLETSQEEGEQSATTNTSSTNNRENREPAWKKMLQAATAEQEQLMGQMINLQKAQTESSPRNTATTNTSRIQKSGQAEKVNPESSVKVNDDDLNLSTVSSSTPLIQKLSSRNTKLQNEWQSQQVENVKLQDKMNAIQAKVYDQQKQWEQDQDDLFSPTRSKTKIPRWTGSSAGGGGDGGTAVAAMTPTTLSSKMHKTTDWVSPTNKSLQHQQQQELLESNNKMRNLQAQLEESKKVQQSQKDELDDYKNRLQKRDLQHHDLLFQYETGKKSWQDSTKEINSKHESEIRSCQNDMEDARDKLHQQINVNQDLREENQKLKSSTNLLKDEFHCYTKELEGLHEEELEAWKSKVNDQDQHIEMEISNNTDLKTQLEEAHARYVHLERKHDTEVKEWKLLLDADINKKALNESATRNMIGGAGLEILSPIRNASSTRQQQNIYGDNSGDSYSSAVSVESAPSESMGKIDELMDELEEMDLERTAILNEINCNDNIQAESEDSPSAFPSAAATMILTDAKSTEPKEEKLQCLLDNTDGYFIDADDEDPPKPIESPANSVNGNGEETNASNTMSDSVVLDETLTLLNNLKNMMTCQGEGNEYETDVLERLEVLSELMQDQSGYQSLLSSVLHQDVSGKQHDDDASGGEGSFEISTSNANDTSWISTLKAAAEENPWPALVAELRSRCEFLERDRDEVTRITDKILEMERSSHKVELDAAVATTERKANENLHQVQLETNREMNSIYRNMCLQCQKKVYM